MKKINILCTSLIMCSFSFLNAQSNTVATGGEASGLSGSVSYTVGQIDYNAYSGANGTINQGVQQPYELFQLSSIDEFETLISVSIGPNPTHHELFIQLAEENTLELNYSLVDLNGKTIYPETKFSKTCSLDMRNLSTGTYFLRIQNEQKEINTFKVVKN